MKSLLMFTLILVAYSAASAQMKDGQNKKQFIASTAVYFSGMTADILSSRGRMERNPLLTNRDGSANFKRAVAISVVPYALSLWLDHKHHSNLANVLRFAGGAVHWDVAVVNWRTR